MLGEPVKAFHVIGGGLTLAGVACAQIFRQPLTRVVPDLADERR
jgi:hypothetical protein